MAVARQIAQPRHALHVASAHRKCPELDSMDNNVTQARSGQAGQPVRLSVQLSVPLSPRAACHVARQRRLDKFITTLLALLPLWQWLWGKFLEFLFILAISHFDMKLTNVGNIPYSLSPSLLVCVCVSDLGVSVSSVN